MDQQPNTGQQDQDVTDRPGDQTNPNTQPVSVTAPPSATPSGPIATSGRKQILTKVVFGVFAAFLILVFVGMAASTKPSNNKTQKPTKAKPANTQPSGTSPQAQKPVTQAKPVQQPTSQAKTSPQPPTMLDKLWQAADISLKTRKNIDISYDATSKVAFIEHTDTDPYSADGFVRQAYSMLALYGQEAFKIDGVEHLNVQNKCKLTDQYGNDSVHSCVTIDMPKEQFSQFNWKNLEYQEVDTRIENASEVYIIVPAIKSQTHSDKLYLVLHFP